MFNTEIKSTAGYKLFDKGNGIYEIVTPRGSFTGLLKEVCFYSVNKLGFEMSELELGVLEMEKHFHNAAEYGVLKRFMWSYDLEENNEKATRH